MTRMCYETAMNKALICFAGSHASAHGSRLPEPHFEPDVAQSCSPQAFRDALETADQQAGLHSSNSTNLLPQPLQLICQATSTSSYAPAPDACSGSVQPCKASPSLLYHDAQGTYLRVPQPLLKPSCVSLFLRECNSFGAPQQPQSTCALNLTLMASCRDTCGCLSSGQQRLCE